MNFNKVHEAVTFSPQNISKRKRKETVQNVTTFNATNAPRAHLFHTYLSFRSDILRETELFLGSISTLNLNHASFYAAQRHALHITSL